MELIEDLFCKVNPIPVKRALNLMGFGQVYRECLLQSWKKQIKERWSGLNEKLIAPSVVAFRIVSCRGHEVAARTSWFLFVCF